MGMPRHALPKHLPTLTCLCKVLLKQHKSSWNLFVKLLVLSIHNQHQFAYKPANLIW